MRMKLFTLLGAVIIFFGLTCAVSAATFQGLGFTEATGISADGQVVVGLGAGSQAVRWTPGGGIQALGHLPGDNISVAHGVSGDGNVVVGRSTGGGDTLAFSWTAGGGMTSLGDFSGGDVYSVALGASYDGGVIAGLGEKEKDIGGGYSNDYPEAFSYSGGSMQGLGLLDASLYYPSSRAYDVSDDGGVIVGDSANSAGTEAFRWTQSGGMVGLGDLAGGAHQSTALAVSPDGNVVVGYGRTASATSEAFRWAEATGMEALGFLDGANHSQAQDVSADGSLVVGDSFTPSGRRAFIWDETNGMQDLYDLLVALGAGDELTDWTLTYAMAISPDGMTVAGNGYNPAGGQEAWIATLEPGDASVPVPAAVWLLGSGLIGLAGLRRKMRR